MDIFSISKDPWTDKEFGKKMMRWASKKFNAHIGFLLESVFEAFPQCIIQLSCLLWHREFSSLALFSLMISIITIASKASVVSFSSSPYVYRFNFMSIWADIFGFFAILTWVMQQENQNSLINWLFGIQFKAVCTWVFLSFCTLSTLSAIDYRNMMYRNLGRSSPWWGLNWRTVKACFSRSCFDLKEHFRGRSLSELILLGFQIGFGLVMLVAIPSIGIMVVCIFPMSLLSGPFILFEVERVTHGRHGGNHATHQVNFLLEGGVSIASCDERFAALSKNYDTSLKDLKDEFSSYKRMERTYQQVKKKICTDEWKMEDMDLERIVIGLHLFIVTPLFVIFVCSLNFVLPFLTGLLSSNIFQLLLSLLYLVFISFALYYLPYTVLYRFYSFILADNHPTHYNQAIEIARFRLRDMREIENRKFVLYKTGEKEDFPLEVLHIINDFLPTHLGDARREVFIDFLNHPEVVNCGRYFLDRDAVGTDGYYKECFIFRKRSLEGEESQYPLIYFKMHKKMIGIPGGYWHHKKDEESSRSYLMVTNSRGLKKTACYSSRAALVCDHLHEFCRVAHTSYYKSVKDFFK